MNRCDDAMACRQPTDGGVSVQENESDDVTLHRCCSPGCSRAACLHLSGGQRTTHCCRTRNLLGKDGEEEKVLADPLRGVDGCHDSRAVFDYMKQVDVSEAEVV